MEIWQGIGYGRLVVNYSAIRYGASEQNLVDTLLLLSCLRRRQLRQAFRYA
jgi:hypothetical protein